MAARTEVAAVPDEYVAAQSWHERDLLAEVRAAGFTDAEQAQLMEALDAVGSALTPWQQSLVDRHRAYVYPEVT